MDEIKKASTKFMGKPEYVRREGVSVDNRRHSVGEEFGPISYPDQNRFVKNLTVGELEEIIHAMVTKVVYNLDDNDNSPPKRKSIWRGF